MALNKVAAAYLAYFAYIDDALEVIPASDFVKFLAKIPAGPANGPWKLCWGPAVNDGILGYVAQGADGSYALAFRGTDVDGSISGSFTNVLADANGFMIPWLYPQQANAPLKISAGINSALALAIGLTDPVTGLSPLDYLRGLAKTGTLNLMVTGHSLGAAMAVVATAWLNNQLAKWAQCATPGTMTRSTSAKISSSDVPVSGGAASNCARTAPGLAFGAIGRSAMFSR